MQVIYDVSHNIAKFEEHMIDGRPKQLCIHRKGSTRAFPAHHPLIPVDFQLTGKIFFKDYFFYRTASINWRINGYLQLYSDWD